MSDHRGRGVWMRSVRVGRCRRGLDGVWGGGKALDRVVFVVDCVREGVVLGVEVPGVRCGLLVDVSVDLVG